MFPRSIEKMRSVEKPGANWICLNCDWHVKWFEFRSSCADVCWPCWYSLTYISAGDAQCVTAIFIYSNETPKKNSLSGNLTRFACCLYFDWCLVFLERNLFTENTYHNLWESGDVNCELFDSIGFSEEIFLFFSSDSVTKIGIWDFFTNKYPSRFS